jgi:hypothetical protein
MNLLEWSKLLHNIKIDKNIACYLTSFKLSTEHKYLQFFSVISFKELILNFVHSDNNLVNNLDNSIPTYQGFAKVQHVQNLYLQYHLRYKVNFSQFKIYPCLTDAEYHLTTNTCTSIFSGKIEKICIFKKKKTTHHFRTFSQKRKLDLDILLFTVY